MELNEKRMQLIAEAKTWIDTPFVSQGRLKGIAVDCGGLVLGTGWACGWTLEQLPEFTDYAPTPIMASIIGYMNANFTRIARGALTPGNVALIKNQWTGYVCHTGILSQLDDGTLSLVQAVRPGMLCKEVTWTSAHNRFLVGVFEYPGVDD